MEAPPDLASVRFGEFELFPKRRRLEQRGAMVQLSNPAMDLLIALADRPGEVVGKRELLDRVWPQAVVGEGSIRFHMVAIRRALNNGGPDVSYIVTVPGRGYCFVGIDRGGVGDTGATELTPAEPHSQSRPEQSASDLQSAVLAARSQIVGRDKDIAEVLRSLNAHRFVTVVGPGGMGKSAVAVHAARLWREATAGAVSTVDLSHTILGEPEAVIKAVAAGLGVPLSAASLLDAVIDHLRRGRHLLVLDTCEAAIDGVAQVAEAIFASAPQARLLATSREALRAEGEIVYQLASLRAPCADAAASADHALSFPAVQLFVARAASAAGFELCDVDAPLVSAICRHLDGVALAIELVASQVAAFGLREVEPLLTSDVALTWPGLKTAPHRHKTLGAALNWSYELLSDDERAVLRRLSVFTKPFVLDAALSVTAVDGLTNAEAAQAITGLIAKSLLIREGGAARRYRMLNITRAFALAKLAVEGEGVAALHVSRPDKNPRPDVVE